MKLLLSALLLAAFCGRIRAKSGCYRSAAPVPQSCLGLESLGDSRRPSDQTGCPVVLTSAHLNWPASYLPVTSAEKVTEPNLALGFQNSSGKAIRSVSITAQFLGKTEAISSTRAPSICD